MSEVKEKKSDSLYPPQQQLSARQSSLFSRESFHEEMMKKREANRSVVALAQQPDEQTVTSSKPKVLYENTYKVEPEIKFKSSAAQSVINDILETHLRTESYDPNASAQMTKTLAQIIKDGVKELNYKRYKIVCIVTIGQMLDGDIGMLQASRCVWDTNWDTFASGVYTNKTLYGVATVYAVYQE